MKILIADDDFDLRLALLALLPRWGFEVLHASDGIEAWQVLQGANAPRLAIIDWMMPGLDGLEVCRLVRDNPATAATYIILLTGRTGKEDLVAGLEGGADEYLVKPVELDELRGRLHAARRIVELQERLAHKVSELQDALGNVRQLEGLLPICSYCKRVRDDHNYWQQVEDYVAAHSRARFSHGICPECLDRVARNELETAGGSSPLAPRPSGERGRG
jgi:CheY-like chemotaxis protein